MTATLQRGQTLPDFTLDDIQGNTVSSRSYYMWRNMVVALLPDSADASWNSWLRGMKAAMSSLPENDAICLVIVPGSSIESISSDDIGTTSSFKLLVDHDGSARARFDAQGDEGELFIADRYGVIFHTASGSPESPELDPENVPGWVDFIACQCS